MYVFVLIISIILMAIYVMELRKTKFNINIMVAIAICSAMGYILNLIKFATLPQGGSITFFSMLPVMLLTFTYGRGVGLTAGMLLGFLKTFDGAVLLNPFQFFLDYLLSNMCLGFCNMFGKDSRIKIFLGCLISGFLCVMFNVFSGVLFYSQFAPSGVNPFAYSILYNFSSIGVEAILTSIVMMIIPLQRIIDTIKKQNA